MSEPIIEPQDWEDESVWIAMLIESHVYQLRLLRRNLAGYRSGRADLDIAIAELKNAAKTFRESTGIN